MAFTKNIALVAMGLTVLFGTQSTMAQMSSWTAGGGADTKFTQTDNWSNGVPDGGTDAVFFLTNSYEVFINDDVATDVMQIANGEFNFFGGNELRVNSIFQLQNGARVFFEDDNTQVVVSNDNLNMVGDSFLSVRNGANLEVKNDEQDGSIFVQADSDLSISNATVKADRIRSGFGTTPTGYIQLDSGAIVSTLDARIGQIPASDSGLLIFGDGSEWFTDDFLVGVFGIGDVALKSGGSVVAIDTVVACEPNSSGQIRVVAEGSKWNSNQLSVGRRGTGTLQLTTGGDVQAADIVVGELTSGSGVIDIQDSGSTLTVSGTLKIGNAGTGTYSQDEGSASVSGMTTINSDSSFTLSNATFISGGMENLGTMEFSSGFANLQTAVSVLAGGDIQVTTSNPVNFLQDLQHNGSELFIEAGDRVNVFGNYTGNGQITGAGVIHFRGNIDPGQNANPNTTGSIFSEADVVLENTASLHVRLDGSDLTAGDTMVIDAAAELQSPGLTVLLANSNQVQDGDEFLILKHSEGMTGTFQGLPEGALAHQSGNINLTISYVGGDGSDVVLIADVQTGNFELAASSFSTFRGIQIGGNLGSIQTANDVRLRYNPGFTVTSNEAPVWVVFDGTLPTDSPSALKLFYEANTNTPGLTVTVEAYNWNTSSFDELDSFAASFGVDENVGIVISGQLEYVEPGTNKVRARLGWRKTGFTISFPWEVGVDWMGWSGG